MKRENYRYVFIVLGILFLVLITILIICFNGNDKLKGNVLVNEDFVDELDKNETSIKNDDIILDDNINENKEGEKEGDKQESDLKPEDKDTNTKDDISAGTNSNDKDNKIDKDKVDNNVEKKDTEKENNKDKEDNKDSNSSDNKNQNEVKEPDKEVAEPEQPVIDEIDVYRKKIEKEYGITIKYGDEIGDYKPQRLTPTKLLDSDKIKTNLGYVETELKKYPAGFFKDFEGMPLTIFLVASVPNNAFSGFTDRQFMNDIKITVVDSYAFSYTLNHEIMHYIDAYLEIKMYPNEPYQEYMNLNPVGFTYGSTQGKYNYGYNGQVKGAYFLNSYSQLDVREDRAEVFKQMMTRVYKPAGMFDEGEIMRKKALIISEQIKAYFPSAKGIQYWDKIIG